MVASLATSLAKIPAVCASSELRLVIITNDKEVVLGRREKVDEPQQRGVDVLELVHQDMREAALPAVSQRRILVE